MSYYDPKIYNDKSLNEKDRKLLDMYDIAIEDVGNKEYIIDNLMDLYDEEGSDTLIKIQREIAAKTISAVQEYMQLRRMEIIVSMLETAWEDKK